MGRHIYSYLPSAKLPRRKDGLVGALRVRALKSLGWGRAQEGCEDLKEEKVVSLPQGRGPESSRASDRHRASKRNPWAHSHLSGSVRRHNALATAGRKDCVLEPPEGVRPS